MIPYRRQFDDCIFKLCVCFFFNFASSFTSVTYALCFLINTQYISSPSILLPVSWFVVLFIRLFAVLCVQCLFTQLITLIQRFFFSRLPILLWLASKFNPKPFVFLFPLLGSSSKEKNKTKRMNNNKLCAHRKKKRSRTPLSNVITLVYQ